MRRGAGAVTRRSVNNQHGERHHGPHETDVVQSRVSGLTSAAHVGKQVRQDGGGVSAVSEAREEEPRLVLVEWEDSFGCSSSWENVEGGVTPSALRCRSVGWLVYDSDDCVVVVPHLTRPHGDLRRQGCGDMAIPIRAVVRMTDLTATTH